MVRRYFSVLLLFISIFSMPVSATERPYHLDTFSLEGLSQGSKSTQNHCLSRNQTVWVITPDGGGECIKYFAAGLDVINPIAIVHFPGDVADVSVLSQSIKNIDPGYLELDERSMTLMTTVNAFRSGVPFIFIGRPGTFGSSGYHGMRLTEMNPRILDAALNAIKQKHKILNLTLSGQSGGGAVVSALLNWRTDIRCAVMGSSAGARFEKTVLANPGLTLNRYKDHIYDPSEHIHDMPKDEDRQIYFLSDPHDKVVQMNLQHHYYSKVKKAGHRVAFKEFTAPDHLRHDLSGYAMNVATACSTGIDEEGLDSFLAQRDVKSIYDIDEELKILMKILTRQNAPG